MRELSVLDAAIEQTPIIDNHAHPLLKLSAIGTHSLLSLATEANGAALNDSWSSLAHIRATKHLSQILDCGVTWEAVESAIKGQRAKSWDSWVRRCMRGIETILLDDGLDGRSEVEAVSWHDGFVRSKCKRIVRIEAVATDLIHHHVTKGAAPEKMFQDIKRSFSDEIERALSDPNVVGFKSIICYRGGLDVPHVDDIDLAKSSKALKSIIEQYTAEQALPRLDCPSLIHIFIHITAQLITASNAEHKKPIQFHTGLGDNDITLAKSSPSHLQKFIKQYSEVPIVLLHGSYPWTREAGYLAAMYKNVYADIGEVFPFISRDGQEHVLKQILELCPWTKILWSTDGHWFPETYVLATTQIKSVLKTVLGDLVRTDQLNEIQAVQLVQDILFSNSNKLYHLQLDIPLSLSAQQVPPGRHIEIDLQPGTSWPNEIVMETLQSMDCKWLRVMWHDYTSSPRCRMIPVKRVIKTLESGKPLAVSITKAALGLLAVDMMIPEINASGAYTCVPDWSSLRLGPAPGHASVFCEFRELDGSESALCPRTLLRKAVDRATTCGLSFLLGFEVEFVVVERNPDSTSRDKYRTVRNDGHAWAMSRAIADMGRQGSFNSAIDEIVDALDEAGILIEQFHPENAPGQYEIVLPALPPMESCEALLHTRQIIESVAARYNFRLTLHPKPFATACGSASHAHMSISSPGGNDPEVYEAFYAGILKHFRALIAFTYSNPTSYERMVDSFWAGGRWVTWGTQNKEAPLRKCEDGHWELKTLDGLANPYFAMAAILTAGTQGIISKEPMIWKDCELDPAKLTVNERKELGISEMFPANLGEALQALEDDEELCGLLGQEFVQRYINVKNAEIRFLDPMTDQERRQWILERY